MVSKITIKLSHQVVEVKQLLNEVSLEKAKESLDSKKLRKAIKQYAINYAQSNPWEWKDIFDDEGYNILPDKLDLMVSTMHDSLKGWIWDMIPEDIETDRTRRDKSNQALALLWLLRLMRTQPRMMKKVVHDYAEDDESIMEDLHMYFNYKHLMEKPDLNQIGGIGELAQVVLDARDDIRDYQEKQSYANVEEGTEVFRDDEDWFIAALHNKGAACELGKGTDWCTAAPGLDYFAEYYEEDDPLFYFEQREEIPDAPLGFRYQQRMQFHYGSGQFMDDNDRPLPHRIASRLHNMLMRTEAPEKYSILRKHDRKFKIKDPSTHPEVLDELLDSEEMEYGDYMKIADHPNASEETLRKLMHLDISAKDYLGGVQGLNSYAVSLKGVLAKREVSPEFAQELWEKTWGNYQEAHENWDRSLRGSEHNKGDSDWYANVSPRQFHRLKEFFLPVWKKIAWNPTVATSTLEEILEKTDPDDYVKEMIKQKIMAREAGEEELDFHELRRRVVALKKEDPEFASPRITRSRLPRNPEDLQESKVFSRWQKIIN